MSPQLASIEAQRASAEKQTASVKAQTESVVRQHDSVKKQSELLPKWTPLPPVAVIRNPQDVPQFVSQDLPQQYDCEPMAPGETESLIHSAAAREALPAELLRAVIKRESGFKPCAVSNMGAQGLMQLMPATAVDLHVDNAFDPRENIRGGAAYLKQLVNRYGGDLRKALGAYNAGMARVDSFGGIPDLLETQNYVSNITGDLGYDQLPLYAGQWNERQAALDGQTPAETILDNPSETATRDFHPAALHLSLGSVQFGSPQDTTVSVPLPDSK